MLPRILLALSLATSTVLGQVTVYTSATGSAALAQYTVASTDQTVLVAPAPPADFNPATFIQLYDGGMTGMSGPVVSRGFCRTQNLEWVVLLTCHL